MTLNKNILKKIKDIKFSKFEPTSEFTLWAKPTKGNSYAFLVFNNGSWQPLSFSGGGGGGGPVSWNDIEDKPDFATVATSGSYEDLTDTPGIWSSSLPIPANPVAEEINSIVTVGSVAQNLAEKEDALYYIPPIYYEESQYGKTPILVTTDTSSFQTIIDVVTASGGGWDTVQYKDLAIPTVAAIEQKIPAAVTETTVSGWGFTKNTGTYSMPSTGIPATDLASAVQTSLGKADSALQTYTETDPIFTASAAYGISSSDISNWSGKQDALVFNTTYDATTNKAATVKDVPLIYIGTNTNWGTDSFDCNLNPAYFQGGAVPTKEGDYVYSTGNGNLHRCGPIVSVSGQNYNKTTPTYIGKLNSYPGSAASGITSTDITNWNGKTSNVGTITSVKMNGSTVASSGEADLGTVITSHQDISGKADKVVVVDASTLPSSLDPNKVYQMGTLTGSVTIPAFSAVASGDTEAKIWCFTFNTSTTAPTITWPAAITNWVGGSAPTIDVSKSYEVTVMDGIGAIMEA